MPIDFDTTIFDQVFIEKVVNLFCTHLGIKCPTLLIYIDETIQANGICYQNNETEFMILLKDGRTKSEMLVTLAHELVHVKQYLKDNLAGQWDTSIPYNDRWWEQEAYVKESDLIKILLDAIKNKDL